MQCNQRIKRMLSLTHLHSRKVASHWGYVDIAFDSLAKQFYDGYQDYAEAFAAHYGHLTSCPTSTNWIFTEIVCICS